LGGVTDETHACEWQTPLDPRRRRCALAALAEFRNRTRRTPRLAAVLPLLR